MASDWSCICTKCANSECTVTGELCLLRPIKIHRCWGVVTFIKKSNHLFFLCLLIFVVSFALPHLNYDNLHEGSCSRTLEIDKHSCHTTCSGHITMLHMFVAYVLSSLDMYLYMLSITQVFIKNFPLLIIFMP